MVKDAEANAEADKKRREEADLRNEVDQLVFQTDKVLADLKDKISEEEVKKAEAARDELKAAIEANDLDQMKAKRDTLNEIVQNLTVKLYEQAAAQTQAAQDDGWFRLNWLSSLIYIIIGKTVRYLFLLYLVIDYTFL